MAILKLGELVAGIRGTIGGTIYSANLSGPYARGWARGPNPRSSYQMVQRGFVSQLSAEWRALTDQQRSDWDDYAAAPAQELENSLGESYYASGFNWFTRINTHLLNAERATREDPPVLGRPAVPTITYLLVQSPIDAKEDAYVWYPMNEFDGFDCIVFLAFAPSTGLLWRSHGYTFVWGTDVPFPFNYYFGLTTLARFGNPVIGSKAFVSVSRQNTQGERSAPASATTDVTAA